MANEEENQAFSLILEHSSCDENSLINMSRYALAALPRHWRWKRRDCMT